MSANSKQFKNYKRVLLIEPENKYKFPPLGLMKIATEHKLYGDELVFYRGKKISFLKENWDIIYISSLFTFQWRKTIETINFYKNCKCKILIGGILASLMPEQVKKATGLKAHIGPLKGNISKILRNIGKDRNLIKMKSLISKYGIDFLPPDYGIFENMDVPYEKFLKNSYILRSTKGCIRNCDFCSVKVIEPTIINKIYLEPYIMYIADKWGEKKNLVLLDDNLLFSSKFSEIINEIRDLGFHRGAKFEGKKREVDFNQGLDIRLLNKDILGKLSMIAIKTLRVAFDDIEFKKTFIDKIKMAFDHGFSDITTYILYNFKDKPVDLYRRLEIINELNEKFSKRISSFPMKYIPSNTIDRNYIGKFWTKRQLRGVQCILNFKRGIVPTKPDFFKVAFGSKESEFLKIIQMPEHYIIYRSNYLEKGMIKKWKDEYDMLHFEDRIRAQFIISKGKVNFPLSKDNKKFEKYLSHYKNEKENH